MGKSGQKIQTSSYKISHGDIMYRIVPVVNNTYCMFESCYCMLKVLIRRKTETMCGDQC